MTESSLKRGSAVAVLGAGTVGVCCALALLRDGHRVTLIDRADPGLGCSYGNAGILQLGAVVPVATSGILRQVPRMLLDKDQPLSIRWSYLPRLLPYLTRFVLASSEARVAEIATTLSQLLSHARAAYADLAEVAAAQSLFRVTGELYVYETEGSFGAALKSHELRRSLGVEVQFIDANGIKDIEPSLAPRFCRGAFLPACISTADPYLVTRAFFDTFLRLGGRFLRADVDRVAVDEHGVIRMTTRDGALPDFKHMVLAAGAFSSRFFGSLGLKVSLDTERGYHLMCPRPGVRLSVPVISGDFKFALSSLDGGLRIAGTAELAGLHAPPNYGRAMRLLPLAKRYLPQLDAEGAEPWMGHRPSTPDSLPVIDRSPRYRNVILAFGHGHLGLTLGALTGQLVARLVADREPPFSLSRLAVGRFA